MAVLLEDNIPYRLPCWWHVATFLMQFEYSLAEEYAYNSLNCMVTKLHPTADTQGFQIRYRYKEFSTE